MVYGKESAEASKARALKKAADLGQLSVLDSLKRRKKMKRPRSWPRRNGVEDGAAALHKSAGF